MRRARNLLAFAVLAVTLWMCFDNVVADDGDVRTLAEKAACTKKKCDQQHGLTRGARRPWGETYVYAWRDGEITVDCHRAYYVAGERQCVAE